MEDMEDKAAFPSDRYGEIGMTLRDYFAAKVLQVMCEDFLPTEAATSAYEYADAMLKARGE
jgi:hypothetical protein